MLNSIQDGAQLLLKETALALLEFPDLDYIVIGGWCPVLRNKTTILHPGTLDVDLLFGKSYQSGAIEDVIKHFLKFGFIPSAKHDFQLMKVQEIKGKDYVFNIDLLHPEMLNESTQMGMFVDHLELDVPLTTKEKEFKKMKSIVLPNSEILFLEEMFSTEIIQNTSFKLVSFSGMFLTKMDSCQSKKRERDAFDIYLGFLGNCIDVREIKRIAKDDNRIGNSLSKFTEFLQTSGSVFDNNVGLYAKDITNSPAKLILAQINI